MILATQLDENNNIDFSNGGRRTFLTGVDGLAQRHKNRLSVFRGEWFKDLSLGVPYVQSFLGTTNKKTSVLRSLILKELKSVPETGTITELTLITDSPTRSLAINYSAGLENSGETATVEVTL